MKKMLLFMGILCLIIFCIFYYKTLKNGNNISNKNQEEIIEYISTKMQGYVADMEVTVYSNKTQNVYRVKQEVTKEKSIQEVLQPETIAGMRIEQEGSTLRVSHTQLHLEKVYEDYAPMLNNALFLDTFVEDFKTNPSKTYELEDELILETKLVHTPNTYMQYKELHLDKHTKKITQLMIKDTAKKPSICIHYNDIEMQ